MTIRCERATKAVVAVAMAGAAMGAMAGEAAAQLTNKKGVSAYYTTVGSSSSGAVTYNMGARELTVGSSSYWAYCVDPWTSAPAMNVLNTYSTASLASFTDGSASSGYAAQMQRYGKAYDATTQAAVQSNLAELFSYAYSDSLTSDAKSTAFGWAVWEIVMQDWSDAAKSQFSSDSGTLKNWGTKLNSGDQVQSQAKNYLTALSNNSWSSYGLGTQTNWTYTVYYDATSPYTQAFMTVTAPESAAATNVPEPGSLALAAAALLGLGWSGRRGLRR